MIGNFDTRAVSSFFLWIDNKILQKGSGFSTTSANFYPTNNIFNGYYAYSAPYKQFVSDFSVSGATVITGVYLNNIPIGSGQSGLAYIDYEQGQALFTSPLPSNATISGTFSVKDFNVSLTNDPEEKILFETKHYLVPRISQVTTGFFNNEVTYPIIYIKNDGSNNAPFAFGGQDLTKINMRAIILADSQYNLDAVCGLLRDTARTCIPLIGDGEQPFNNFGGFKGANYNYLSLSNNKITNGSGVYIEDVQISRFNRNLRLDVTILSPQTYFAFADFVVSAERYPRQS